MDRIAYDRLVSACRKATASDPSPSAAEDLASSVWLACIDAPARTWTLEHGTPGQLARLVWVCKRDLDRSRWARRRRELASPAVAAPPMDALSAVVLSRALDTVSSRAVALVSRLDVDGADLATVAGEMGSTVPTVSRWAIAAREEIRAAL